MKALQRAAAEPSLARGRFTAAQLVILSYVIIMMCILATGGAGPLHYLFPVLSVLAGVILIRTSQAAYVSFSIWLWLLAPVARRLIDFRSYYLNPSPILLAPLLVACLTFPAAILTLKSRPKQNVPHLLVLTALAWGLIVGLLMNPIAGVLQSFLLWAAPVAFGLYVLGWSENEARKSRLLQDNLVWAVLIMGAYGVYQFVVAPTWDCAWLDSTNQALGFSDGGSWGRSEPYGIRVWSTLNSPGVFGYVMMCSLVLVTAAKHFLRVPALAVGYIAFLLSLHRASWAAYLIGIAGLILYDSSRRSGYLAGICIAGILSLPLIGLVSTNGILSERFLTFQQLDHDISLQTRVDVHKLALSYIGDNPWGSGLTSDPFIAGGTDSGILTLLIVLGWPGALCYVAALATLTVKVLKGHKDGASLRIAYKAVTIATLAYTVSGDVGYGVQGVFLWCYAALACPNLVAAPHRLRAAWRAPAQEATPYQLGLRPPEKVL